MRFFFAFFLLFFVLNSAEARTDHVVGADIPSGLVCNIVDHASGPVAQAIATLVIIITGYSFFIGKVSIGMLFIVAAGIMFVFGAQTIMGWILGSEFVCTTFSL